MRRRLHEPTNPSAVFTANYCHFFYDAFSLLATYYFPLSFTVLSSYFSVADSISLGSGQATRYWKINSAKRKLPQVLKAYPA